MIAIANQAARQQMIAALEAARPTARGEMNYKIMLNQANWKFPTHVCRCECETLAYEIAAACDWYLGGHELTEANGVYLISSKGYYHYIGS